MCGGWPPQGAGCGNGRPSTGGAKKPLFDGIIMGVRPCTKAAPTLNPTLTFPEAPFLE